MSGLHSWRSSPSNKWLVAGGRKEFTCSRCGRTILADKKPARDISIERWTGMKKETIGCNEEAVERVMLT